jgi:hypothetical protein
MFKQALLAALIGATLATVPFAVSAQSRTYIIREAPPPPREEARPDRRRGHEWAPGHWEWRNGRHVWIAGHWVRERRGSHWVPDQWVERNGRWHLVRGHWAHGERNRDRDGDGVPNRYDSRPDNPRRQ